MEPAQRKIAGYSKGMRQRIKLAQAICHAPSVLVLDEPLNGLDPLVRAETIALFRALAEDGMHVIISSHILHEVDQISDQVILLSNGYVVAEGQIRGVRSEMQEHPMQILIRCNRPGVLAAKVFEQDSVVEARIHKDGLGVLVKTRDPDKFYLLLNHIAQNGVDHRIRGARRRRREFGLRISDRSGGGRRDESAVDHPGAGRPAARNAQNVFLQARILDLSAGIPAGGAVHAGKSIVGNENGPASAISARIPIFSPPSFNSSTCGWPSSSDAWAFS